MKKKMKKHQHDKGSALLVSLMVMVGLSLLGLAFVAISETESAISINERNYAQTLHVAEAGARTVAQWFNDPEWALENGLMPANSNTIKQERRNNIISATSNDRWYKFETSTDLLCDIPFNQVTDRFYAADENSSDIVITYNNASTFLDQFNSRLFKDTEDGGRVISIRIYGPPVVAGTTTTIDGRRYWNQDVGTRYGLATVAVTAEKTRDGSLTGTVVSRRTVRVVIAEFPLPGADGPLQSGGGTGTTGNFRVHWGKVISNREIAVKRLNVGLPWVDAWTPIPYERGYAPEHAGAPLYLHELINKEFEDPWFWVAARMTATPPPGSPGTSGTDQLWTYTVNDVETNEGNGGYSGHFQNQDTDDPPDKRNTFFTRPVYEVWKQIALAGAGQQGIYYLRYNSTTQKWYDTTGDTRVLKEWINTYLGGEEGFFFFDTTDFSNPQNADGTTNTGILTPAVSLNSASGGNPFLMRGFFYMNMVKFGTDGINSPGKYVNYPAEPFRDVGYQKVNPANGKLMCDDPTGPNAVDCDPTATPPATSPFIDNETNDIWDYQDLNGNNVFDFKVKATTAIITPPGTDSAALPVGTYFIQPYSPTAPCGIAGLGTECSEPHEPYLNLVYPSGFALQTASGNAPFKPQIKWEATATRRPKKVDNAGAPITCAVGSPISDCTYNGYDEVGPVVIPGAQATDGPVLEGVIYNEGKYDAGGNATYYGALLFQGTVEGSGSPIVFFDDSLRTGEWAKKFENMPRTLITTIETDQ